ncbi:sulfatase-like hydrolase/transferase [Flavivirga aquimarina]|uniref:Sulfatase-like hydrolase/transferase n=1 Tax=Flavivirga aquimarina TaxID=2027862 RepID=A0ABT8W6L4_9FLAO|nr:sulfatase-like hydrolase/transferase [Flavivirga aquimarina]MDO5968758.1 sulfatase-like hydrolase/transferase [Flavivirga aquimarina]
MRSIKLFLLVLTVFTACNSPKKQKQEEKIADSKRPNILFLFADDQRDFTINALGNTEVITPNLDSLVQTGTTFENAYIMGAMNGAVCAPSRAMLMTGRALFNIDPTGNTIDSAHTTMPKAMEKAGYTTHHIGKWHNGKEAFINSFSGGKNIFFGGMHRQYNVPTFNYSVEGHYEADKMNPHSPKHSSELYADAAIDFLNGYNGKDPFFTYVAFQAPHDPREMPQEYLDMYDDVTVQLPPNFMPEHPFDNGELDIRDEWLAGYPRTSEEVIANIKAYYAMITHLDAQIGRIIQTLKEKDLYENTIIVFAGDNGLAVGQHGLLGKQNLYEHSINVPLIFSGPDIPMGKKTSALAYLSDLYPTFCEMGPGVEAPATVEGASLKEVILSDATVRDATFHCYKNFQRAARNDRYKIIKYNVDNTVTTQLFDLKEDPFETKNLANDMQFSEQLATMELLLKEQMITYNDEADFEKEGWGVPVLLAWKDKTNPEEVAHLRELAKEERKMRGF